jgi:hypothetical protein
MELHRMSAVRYQTRYQTGSIDGPVRRGLTGEVRAKPLPRVACALCAACRPFRQSADEK